MPPPVETASPPSSDSPPLVSPESASNKGIGDNEVPLVPRDTLARPTPLRFLKAESKADTLKQIKDLATAWTHNALIIKQTLEPYLNSTLPILRGPGLAKQLRPEIEHTFHRVDFLLQAGQQIRDNPDHWYPNRKIFAYDPWELFTPLVHDLRAQAKTLISHKPTEWIEGLKAFNECWGEVISASKVEDGDEGPARSLFKQCIMAAVRFGSSNSLRAEPLSPKRATLCPLEEFMTRSLSISPQLRYPLSTLTGWDLTDLEYRLSALIGTLRSAHLYRSRKAPFHHEFVVFCFRNEQVPGPENWIRVERAARVKGRIVQPDSSAPLWGGVKLRESVSFAAQQEDLCQGADELAKITAAPPTALDQALELTVHIRLSELCTQLDHTSQADPLYRLFSANCRWFARRTVLSISQRLTASGVLGRIGWKEKRTDSVQDLAARLLEDPFGGRQLAGDQGEEIKARVHIDLARASLLAQNRYNEGLGYATTALETLRTIRAPTSAQRSLLFETHVFMSSAYYHQGMFGDALKHLDNAKIIKAQSGETSWSFDAVYAETLHAAGRIDEAITIKRTVAEELRLGQDLEELSVMLTSLALALFSNGSVNDALKTIDEALVVSRRATFRSHDSLLRFNWLAMTARSCILWELGRGSEAFEMVSKAVEITCNLSNLTERDSYYRAWLGTTTGQIHSHDSRALSIIVTTTDKIYRSLNRENPRQLDLFIQLLRSWGVSLQRLHRDDEAIAKFSEALIHERRFYELQPLKEPPYWYDEHLADCLSAISIAFNEMHEPSAHKLDHEAISLTKRNAMQSPDTLHPKLAKRLLDYAIRIAQKITGKDEIIEAPDASILSSGFEAIADSVALLTGIAKRDATEIRFLERAFGVLAVYHRMAKEPLEAGLACASEAFLVIESRLASDTQSLYLQRTMEEWATGIKLLYTSSLSAGKPHAEQYLNYLRGLSPDIFPETEYAVCLRDHADWLYNKLNNPEEAETYLDKATVLLKQLCGRHVSGFCSPHAPFLARLLVKRSRLLSILEQGEACNRSRHGLREALGIARELASHEPSRKEYSSLVLEVLEACTTIIGNLDLTKEAVHDSAQAIDRMRILESEDLVERKRRASLALALSAHAELLLACHQNEEAYDASVEGTATAQELYCLEPEQHRETFAVTLSASATLLWKMDRHRESLQFAAQALEHFRVLRRSARTDSLAASTLSAMLGELRSSPKPDKSPETLDLFETSAVVAQVAYEVSPEDNETRDFVAGRLFDYAIVLELSGQSRSAYEVGLQALHHCRAIFQYERRNRAKLVSILLLVGSEMTKSGRREDGLQHLQECITHLQVLYDETPNALKLYTLDIYSGCAQVLKSVGRDKEAVEVMDHAAALAFKEVHHRPSLGARRACAELLCMRLTCHISNEEWVVARALTEKAVPLWRQVQSESSQDLIELANVLGLHTLCLVMTEGSEEDWSVFQEATAAERALYKSRPDEYRGRFSEALLRYALIGREMGHPRIPLIVEHEVVGLSREASERYPSAAGLEKISRDLMKIRQLSSECPDALRGDPLEPCFQSHVNWLSENLGRPDEADRYLQETIVTIREMYNMHTPGIGNPHSVAFAHSLVERSICLSDAGQSKTDREIRQGLYEALGIARELASDDPTRKEYARLVLEVARAYSVGLNTLDRFEEALEDSAQAVDHMRKLVGEDSTDHQRRAKLASMLSVHAEYLSACRRDEEVYDVCTEGIVTARELYDLDPKAFRSTLTAVHENSADLLGQMSRLEDTVKCTVQAIARTHVYRYKAGVERLSDIQASIEDAAQVVVGRESGRLVSRKASVRLAKACYELAPDEMRGTLTSTLVQYASQLDEAGQAQTACEIRKRALGHCRTLAVQNESEHRPLLAKVLHGLGDGMFNTGKLKESLFYLQECAAHYRLLHMEDPEEYRAAFARVQRVHAAVLMRLHRRTESQALSNQAVELARDELDLHPSIPARREYAQCCDAKAKCYGRAEQWTTAWTSSMEAVNEWRSIYTKSKSGLSQLADALALQALHGLRGKRNETWSVIQDAVTMELKLHQEALNPDPERLDAAVRRFARYAKSLGFSDISLAETKDSEKAPPKKSLPLTGDLLAGILVFAERLCTTARYATMFHLWEVAADALRDSLRLWRELDKANPKQHLHRLLDALRDHIVAVSRLGRTRDALSSMAEEITVRRKLMSWESESELEDLLNRVECFKALLDPVKEEYPQYAHAEFLEGLPSL